MSAEPLISEHEYESIQNMFDDIFSGKTDYQTKTRKLYQYFSGTSALLNSLNVHIKSGINTKDLKDIEARKKYFSQIKQSNYKKYSFFQFLKTAFKDELLLDLIEGSIIGLIIGIIKEGVLHGWVDSFAVLLSVFIVASVTALFNYQKQNQLEKLVQEVEKKMLLVRRNSTLTPVDEKDLMTGDILKLQEGDSINVKGVFISGHVIAISSITSKNVDINAEDKEHILIDNPLRVDQGEGEMVVIVSNVDDLENSKKPEEEEEEKTGLGGQIYSLSESIGQIGFIMGILVGITMFVKTIIANYIAGVPWFDLELIVLVIDAYIIMEALKVVAIPEGLPMAGSISLAFSVTKMIKDNVVINHLDKISEISKMNYLIINKSSVINGEPKVKQAYIMNEKFEPFKNNNSLLIKDDIVLNTTTKLVKFGERYVPEGDLVEKALTSFLIDNNEGALNVENLMKEEAEIEKKIKMRVPFNSAYNYMLSVVEEKKNKTYTAYIRGYADTIIKMCDGSYDKDGNKNKIDGETSNVIKEYNDKSYTVLILAKKTVSSPELGDDFFHNFGITAIVAIGDDIQKDVETSIKRCKECGIHIKMVTHDNVLTSLKTCEAIGLISSNDVKASMTAIHNKEQIKKGDINFKKLIVANSIDFQVGMEGSDFTRTTGGFNKIQITDITSKEESESSNPPKSYEYTLKNPAQFAEVINSTRLIADANTEDKAVVISGIKAIDKKNVVGVVFNTRVDLEPLCDISFSSNFSKGANCLQREKCDVILLEHSFMTIVSSIAHARNIYDSIRKFIQFQLTICLVTVSFTVLGNFYFIDTPLSPVQLLWINLIMDSLGAIALATDSPNEDEILKYRPYSGNLFNKTMICNIACQFIFQLLVLLIFLFYGDAILGVPSDKNFRHHMWNDINGYQVSFIFNMFVFMQVFNMLNCRKVHCREYNVFKGIFKNGIFILVFFLVIGVQLIFANFGGRAVRTHILSWKLQLVSVGIGAVSLIINLIGKLIIEDEETLSEDEVQSKKPKKISFIGNRLKERKLLKNTSLSSRKQDNDNISIKINQ